MEKHSVRLTAAQFAALHGVNKRTLHYYDDIGLFHPHTKGENGYRYYDIAQSVDFEYIRMLKELHMSIDEIAAYYRAPSADSFLELAAQKEAELTLELQRLTRMKQLLQKKQEQIAFCQTLRDQEIRTEHCCEEALLLLPYDFAEDDASQILSRAKERWTPQQIRMGIGGFISLDKVQRHAFETYDGLFTPALNDSSHAAPNDTGVFMRPSGTYLCGYQRSAWEELPHLYKEMLSYAKQKDLALTGYAYEFGLNEFAIAKPEEYVTKVMIQIQKIF